MTELPNVGFDTMRVYIGEGRGPDDSECTNDADDAGGDRDGGEGQEGQADDEQVELRQDL